MKSGVPYDPRSSVFEMMRMDGKAALIAGGHGDLAEAAAHALAELGCSVVLAARHADQCEALAASVRDVHGVQSYGMQADVSDPGDVEALVDSTVRRLGRLDVVVNNAGTFWAAQPEDVPLEKGWRRVLDVNLTGTFLICQAAARVMLDRDGGSLINMASSGAFMSFLPEVGSTLSYTTSKGAIVSLTRDLAAAWSARGVRVNALAPGSMASGMSETIPKDRLQMMINRIPMRRQGCPAEIKAAVAFLASPASSYVTGSVVVVDGGQTIV